MTVYLDCCSVSRLTDDQSQSRVRAETDAVEGILNLVGGRHLEWVSSTALEVEILQNPDEGRRLQGTALLNRAGSTIQPDAKAAQRAATLVALGYGPMDALHLACAEQAAVDVLLTTDDRFLRRAMRMVGDPAVRVANPVEWFQEMEPWFSRTLSSR